MQVKDQVQMLLVQDLLDTLSKSMDILPYRRFGGLGSRKFGNKITTPKDSEFFFSNVVVFTPLKTNMTLENS